MVSWKVMALVFVSTLLASLWTYQYGAGNCQVVVIPAAPTTVSPQNREWPSQTGMPVATTRVANLTIAERLKNMMVHYNISKNNSERVIWEATKTGEAVQLLMALVEKYGLEPTSQQVTSMSSITPSPLPTTMIKNPLTLFERVRAMIVTYSTVSLPHLEETFQKAQREGLEQQLLDSLIKRYGPEPLARARGTRPPGPPGLPEKAYAIHPAGPMWREDVEGGGEFWLTRAALDCNNKRHKDVVINRVSTLEKSLNSHVLLIGDSLTRYQYLNMAYWLQTGKWRAPYPNNEFENEHPSWDAFYQATNKRLVYETCDCYRPTWDRTDIGQWENHRENRFYKDPLNHFDLTYIQQFGVFPLFVHKRSFLERGGCVPGNCSVDSEEDTMGKMKGPEVWLRLACEFRPLPTVLVLNSGLWWSYDNTHFGFTEIQSTGRKIKKCNPNIRLIWKTTTPKITEMGISQPDRQLVQLLRTQGEWEVFDAAMLLHQLTRSGFLVGKNAYWDTVHFVPSVYRGLNQALLVHLWGKSIIDGVC